MGTTVLMQTCLSVNSKVHFRKFFRRPQSTNAMGVQLLQCDRYQGFSHIVASHLDRRARISRTRTSYAASNRLKPHTLPQIQYPVSGSNRIESVSYIAPEPDSEEGSVWINQTQYFQGIAPKVWNWSLGGQQLCQKWLQARQNFTLCHDSIEQYQRLVTLLTDVVDLMEQVDSALQKH
jgi:hypothetical protein